MINLFRKRIFGGELPALHFKLKGDGMKTAREKQ